MQIKIKIIFLKERFFVVIVVVFMKRNRFVLY